MANWRLFENLKIPVKQCYQTILIEQKWVENARLQKLKCDILVFFKHHEKCKCIK